MFSPSMLIINLLIGHCKHTTAFFKVWNSIFSIFRIFTPINCNMKILNDRTLVKVDTFLLSIF